MAEHNPGTGREDGHEPVDEDAAWAAIVAGYGKEPADSESPDAESGLLGGQSGDEATSQAEGCDGEGAGAGASDAENSDAGDRDAENSNAEARDAEEKPSPADAGLPPLGSSVTVIPALTGPRDWSIPHDEDEGHFVPPEPPPLPQGDTTAKFAWLAVLGGPLLLLLTVLLRWDMTWWITTLGIGGFLGGFATLIARMKDDDDEDHNDPGRGAVV
ncbi:hypothetical protein ACH429_15560 [Streptomyces pathocidini]|uniref:Uncharacterized protein n=1 Tax=Streptomyces pathocidini TaxID=1650571 RepID=A0ABW7UUR8_9ACTN|nr:hypothetical protein [Streptomyces pathocidini]